MAEEHHIQAPAPMVALFGWIVPGAGYWLIGQRTRGLVIGITILVLFVLGILIGGIRVVEAPDLAGSGSLLGRLLQKPWFIGQALTGPIGLISAYLSDLAANSATYQMVRSTSRVAEIGTLYTAIAGMLNLMAIIDSAYRAGQEKPQ